MAEREISFMPSSNVKKVLYDPETQQLTVSMNGGTWTYHGVSEDTANGFASADSAGRYLHNFVKGIHRHEKIG